MFLSKCAHLCEERISWDSVNNIYLAFSHTLVCGLCVQGLLTEQGWWSPQGPSQLYLSTAQLEMLPSWLICVFESVSVCVCWTAPLRFFFSPQSCGQEGCENASECEATVKHNVFNMISLKISITSRVCCEAGFELSELPSRVNSGFLV